MLRRFMFLLMFFGDPGSAWGQAPAVLPDVTLERAGESGVVRLSDLHGKPVVIDFWATWCESCVRAMAEHEKMASELAGRVHWFAVNVGEDRRTVEKFMAKRRLRVPVLRDSNGSLAQALEMPEMPFAVVADAQLRVVKRVVGEPYPALRDTLRQLPGAADPGVWRPAGDSAAGCAGTQVVGGVAMGTKVQVVVCPRDAGGAGEAAALTVAQRAFAEFGRLEGLWTTWTATSEVSRINRAAGGPPVQVSNETWEVLQAAASGSRETAGLFDITFAPLGEVWRFDTPPGSHEPTKLQRVPTDAEVKDRLARVGWAHLVLDRHKQTAGLDRPGMAIHLGGIGKGAAVDRAVALLRDAGFVNFAVQAGGDLYCAGLNGQRSWRVGIAHPRQKGQLIGSLQIRDAAFSTSGDYERFAILDGRRYHHILDTRTGFPATASQSVTVLAGTATAAEIDTKAAFILGGQAGLDYLRKRGVQGVLVDSDGRVWRSDGLTLEVP